jgi:hypothetical protein
VCVCVACGVWRVACKERTEVCVCQAKDTRGLGGLRDRSSGMKSRRCGADPGQRRSPSAQRHSENSGRGLIKVKRAHTADRHGSSFSQGVRFSVQALSNGS